MKFGLSFLAALAACVGTAALPSVEGTGFRGVSLDWLDRGAPPSAFGKQGYLHFAELKDGKFADISIRNGFRVQKERW